MSQPVPFPEGFLWGAATSSYQIEGAVNEDGRGPSIWDTFCRTEGKVKGGDVGDVACDHYHRYKEDVALMAELGLPAYRFSTAWPRIQPNGRGEPLQAGLDFYSRLVDELLAAGIEPWVTLYHWDLPQALQDEGGWTVRTTAEAFVDYADIVSRHLGDRVKHWITHNEPWCAAVLGYENGLHAPGLEDTGKALAAAHHILLSHGLALPAIRENSPGCTAGITVNLVPAEPASPSEADREATELFDAWFNRWYLDPLYGKGYPETKIADYRAKGKWPAEGNPSWLRFSDLGVIARDTDFLGINYYSRAVIRSDTTPEDRNEPVQVHVSDDTTDIGWEVHPEGLYRLLKRLHRDYPTGSIYITENGAAYSTGPDEKGRIRDTNRLTFVRDHLLACRRAMAEGVPLAGYFQWSLMDNFEWQEGYSQRFGMVYVDYETQKRIPKDTARWYSEVIRENAVDPERRAPKNP